MSSSQLLMVACLSLFASMVLPAKAESLVSPEVNTDRKVTFRLSAPKAQEVKVDIYWGGLCALAKDNKGVWSGTLGPLPPGIYSYHFLVDGLRIVDPLNKDVDSYVPPASILTIKGDKPALWEIRPVPHGTVHMHWYTSKATGTERRFHVYTPPGYMTGKRKYPVLYLLHGYGNDDSTWIADGRANAIIDNLIADSKVQPMIIVMPYGHIAEPFVDISDADWDKLGKDFVKDLGEDILPMVEKCYRVKTDREHRALGGVSMGAWQVTNIEAAYPDKFAWLGLFSGGMLDLKDVPQSLSTTNGNKYKKLLWLGCGRQDGMYADMKKFADVLTANGVKLTWYESDGGHAWLVFRGQFAEFASQLFR
jgi:enterochelin esterase-like enzyme